MQLMKELVEQQSRFAASLRQTWRLLGSAKCFAAHLFDQFCRPDPDVRFDFQQAAAGSPAAQYLLGCRYLTGEGVPHDEAQARVWLAKSAAQGNVDAVAVIGRLTSK